MGIGGTALKPLVAKASTFPGRRHRHRPGVEREGLGPYPPGERDFGDQEVDMYRRL
jgi:hypothetical protein